MRSEKSPTAFRLAVAMALLLVFVPIWTLVGHGLGMGALTLGQRIWHSTETLVIVGIWAWAFRKKLDFVEA